MTSTVDQRKLYNHNLGPAVGEIRKKAVISMLLENRNVDLLSLISLIPCPQFFFIHFISFAHTTKGVD